MVIITIMGDLDLGDIMDTHFMDTPFLMVVTGDQPLFTEVEHALEDMAVVVTGKVQTLPLIERSA